MNFPHLLSSPSGLTFEVLANGAIRRITHGDIMVNLFVGSEADGAPSGIFARIHGVKPALIPLIGPRSGASIDFHKHTVIHTGEAHGLRHRVTLRLLDDMPAWFWHVELENTTSAPLVLSLSHFQDIGIAHYGAIRLNEYYVSQYIDHTPLHHPVHGHAILSRQNQPMGGAFPATLVGSLRHATSFATDAAHATLPLPSTRTQAEHAMVALEDATVTLAAGESTTGGFYGLFISDKPTATTPADIALAYASLAAAQARPHAPGEWLATQRAAPTLFTHAPAYPACMPGEAELADFAGAVRLHEEREDGVLLSFFTPQHHHVVLRDKEALVLRPHGHILRTGAALTPDEASLTSTVWMHGVFHSMVTQGHVSINRFLSTTHSQLGLFHAHGLRVFVLRDGAWTRLVVPSAFLIAPDHCRWLYQSGEELIEITATAPAAKHELGLTIRVLRGIPREFLITQHVAIHGDDGSTRTPLSPSSHGDSIHIPTTPGNDLGHRFPDGYFAIRHDVLARHGGDSLIHADATTRGEPFLVLRTTPTREWRMGITGHLVPTAETGERAISPSRISLVPPAGSPLAPAIHRTAAILPWFVNNAFIHYLSPRGLEQYSGGGWGTRDVCQGAFELLASLGSFAAQRDLLSRVFRQQNADGDWPQWFMFFDRERNIRPGDSHGDIVYWPLLALAQYVLASGDTAFFDEAIPYFHADGAEHAEHAPVLAHVARALALIRSRVVPGTSLPAYGHGDWNDALQPVDPAMRDQLCSAWTITLHCQTFNALAEALTAAGFARHAAELSREAAALDAAFHEQLIVGSTVAGYARFAPSGETRLLLHPHDALTGIRFSVLPMIHAILADLFTPQEAAHHLALIREHLSGPDGAHLFDRPMEYHGGVMRTFQRAESAAYFGREIGNMYMHAQLRYAEALAHMGRAREFFHALCLANPIALRELVPSAAPRQLNCYYSSSDPAFPDRYSASAHYDAALRGEVPLEGGWRVYSSGAGIATRLIVQRLLGIAVGADHLGIDPVIPPELDGLVATLPIHGKTVRVTYHIGTKGSGVTSISSGDTPIPFTRQPNPYRAGAARVPLPVPEELHIAMH